MNRDSLALARARLWSWIQLCLPTHALSMLLYRLTRIRRPLIRRLLIGAFRLLYSVDLHEAEHSDPRSYEDFNAFFTRALRAGARPQPGDARAVSSPVDGTISLMGPLTNGLLLQAKGVFYSSTRLLGGDSEMAGEFVDGLFCTIYLAPHNYHRVHMPLAGRLRRWGYVPGRIFSVGPSTVRALPRVFLRNERAFAVFDHPDGPFAVVLVGALCVSGLEVSWIGQISPPHLKGEEAVIYEANEPVSYARGDEMGRFNMGSTVILLLSSRLRASLALRAPGQPIRMGELLAHRPAEQEHAA